MKWGKREIRTGQGSGEQLVNLNGEARMGSIFSVSGNLGSESLSLKGRKTIVIAAIRVFDGGRFCEYWMEQVRDRSHVALVFMGHTFLCKLLLSTYFV